MFIVIEGLDGAGKSTQVSLIREELKKRGLESEYLHFPRFDSPVYGDLIARFLRGELGDLSSVDPYIVALLYAGDRKNASQKIKEWLDSGKYVIVDRYVYSNIAYQCAKIEDQSQSEILRRWILELEYDHNKIVKPDVTLFLDVPFDFTVNKLSQEREGDDREYLKGKRDIHEESLTLQEKVRRVYLDQNDSDDTFHVVSCASCDNSMLPPDKIFEKIFEKISL